MIFYDEVSELTTEQFNYLKNKYMQIQKSNIEQFPEHTEIWQGFKSGEVVAEHPSRAIVNGYMLRNNIPGKPVSCVVKFHDVYSEGPEPGQLTLNKRFNTLN